MQGGKDSCVDHKESIKLMNNRTEDKLLHLVIQKLEERKAWLPSTKQ